MSAGVDPAGPLPLAELHTPTLDEFGAAAICDLAEEEDGLVGELAAAALRVGTKQRGR